MRKLLLSIALLTLTGTAFASAKCTAHPKQEWMKEADAKAKLEAEGYKIDPLLASKLLDYFGYKKGDDGYRTLPDGKPLIVRIHAGTSARDKAMMEIWKRSLDAIGIRADFQVSSFADNLKAAYRCELPMWGLGGTASIPDGIDMLESYYGPNAGQGNLGCYQSKQFDETFSKARVMPDGPERQALFARMIRLLEADTARVLNVWRMRNWLSQPWVKGFKKHPILHADWQYLDVDKK